MDRRYRQTRNFVPGDAVGEAVARAQLYRARMDRRSIYADEAPEVRSSQAPGETQRRRAEARRSRSAVFDEYGSGELGSGDDSLRQLRQEVSFRPDPRDL